MKHILFVCIENSNRSQMAQAFANMYGGSDIVAYSAGSKPSGKVNPKAVVAMQELGYDLTTHGSKSLDDIPQITYDYIVTMGCGDSCPWVPAKYRLDWSIPDPRNMDEEAFREVRDMIGEHVKELIEELR
jgi:arsenate reductase